MSGHLHTVERHYAFIQRLVHHVSSHAPDAVNEALLTEAQQHFAALQVALWTVAADAQQAVLLNAAPWFIPDDQFPCDTLMEAVLQAAKTEEPYCVGIDRFSAWLHAFKVHPYRAMYVASVVTEQPLAKDLQDVLNTWLALLSTSVAQLQAQAYLHQAQKHHDKRLHEVTALYEIGQAMEGGNLQALLDMITHRATEVMEAQACSLMLLDEDGQTLVIRSSYGLPEAVIEQTRVPWGQGIAGRVAASGQAMLITDPRKDPRLAGEDVPYRDDIEASLCVPLRDNHGGVIGVLNIHRRKPAPIFTEQDMRLFCVFAMQAAFAIKHAQLYRDLKYRVNELSVLSDLSAAVNSTLDLEHILQQTAEGIVETVRFDRCAIFLLDETGKLVTPHAVRGYRPETLGSTPVRIADGVIGMAVKRKELILIENAQMSPQPARGFGRMLGTNAFLVAPILVRNRVIGVVVADNKPSGRPIDQANIQLLTTFINQVGMAIENARLYHDLDRRYSELHNLWEYTRNLLSSIGVGVMSIDRDEIVLTWNNAAERITTVPHERALGYKLQDLLAQFFLPEEEKKMLMEMIRLPFQTGERHSRFKCALHPYQRGEMYFNFESSPLRAPNGFVQGVVFIFEDITREVRMEMEVQRIGQLAAVGQLASTIAHELRNPLSSIRASAQHLRSEYAGNTELCEFLNIIINEVDVLNTKATEFLRFARPVEPVFQDVNLAEIIHNTVQFMRSYIEEQGIHTEVDVSVPFTIKADPTQLKEALRNLIINAVQAMPEGGTLSIIAEPAPADAVSITVKDTGTGIPPEDIDRIFTPFYTTKAKGSGLGLANVQKIVESHSGTISVQSQVGVGTEMRMILPVHPVRRVRRIDLGDGDNLRAAIPDV
ncbi:MAG: GAF domain-containing protein [Armatimonadota bacterium]|nr:GAF domain-containing protein [bacterium]MDW8320534.1 GAF domain-containing protein [Armatimonadota bacterium]